MDTFQAKVNELQSEIENIDSRLTKNTKSTTIFFISAIVTPFATALLLYLTNFQFVQTDREIDRKKIIKWSAIFTVIVWLALYLYTAVTRTTSIL